MSEEVTIKIGFQVATEQLREATELMERFVGAVSKARESGVEISGVFRGVGESVQVVPTRISGVIPSLQQIQYWFNTTEENAMKAQQILREAVQVPEATPRFAAAMRELSDTLGISERMAKKFTRSLMEGAEGVDEIGAKFQFTRQVMQAFIGELGPAGLMFRQMTQQMYWFGIGAMFVGMSLTRLYMRQVTVESRSLTLLRAYRTLAEAQKRLNEAVAEFGPSSEQARDAYIRVMEASEALRTTKQQLRASIMSEYMAHLQLALGALPVVINGIRLVYDAYKWLNVIKQISAAATTEEALQIAVLHIPAVAQLIELYGPLAAKKMVDIYLSKMATMAYITLGFAIATVIGTIIFFIWAQAESERRMREVERRMASMMQSARNLGGAFGSATEATEDFSSALGPHSVVGSAEMARQAVSELYEVLRHPDFPTRLEQRVEVKVPERLPPVVQEIRRVFREELPGVPPLEQEVTRVLKEDIGELPRLPPIVQEVTRVLRSDVPRDLPVLTQEVIRTVVGDVPGLPTLVQEVIRQVTGEVPEDLPQLTQGVVREVLKDVPMELPTLTQDIVREVVRDVPSTLPVLAQKVTRTVEGEIPEVPLLVFQDVYRRVRGEVPEVPQMLLQDVVRRVVGEVPETLPPAFQEVIRVAREVPTEEEVRREVYTRVTRVFLEMAPQPTPQISVNVVFPNMVIRSEEDIDTVAKKIEEVFVRVGSGGGVRYA